MHPLDCPIGGSPDMAGVVVYVAATVGPLAALAS